MSVYWDMRIIGLLVVLLVCGCSNAAESPGSSAPATLATLPLADGTVRLSGSIVYAAGNGTDIRIFEATADGSDRRLLVDMDPGLDMAPQVSPDGRLVLFRHNPSPTTDLSDIWLVDRGTGARRNLTQSAGGRNWGASWSPDGRTIVFNRGRGGGVPELWMMRADGSDVHRVSAGWAEYPCFSPDGRSIVFESRRDGNYEIYTIHADGSALRRLTHTPEDEGDASFSPNGELILFHSQRDSTDQSSSTGSGFETARQIYLMHANGSHQHPILRDRASDELPTFLPDGRILFFSIRLPTVRDDQPRFLGAFVADQAGRRIERLDWPHQEIEVSWIRPRHQW